MINILLWVVFGGLAGWVASLLVGAETGMGILANIVVGIIGAFLGGFIVDKLAGREFQAERPTSIASFATSVVGALVLLVGLNLIW